MAITVAKQIEGYRADVISQSSSSCVFLNTYYGDFLNGHYNSNQQLMTASYDQQLRSLQESFFGDSDFYSKWLGKAGWDAEDLIINCQPLQQAFRQ